MNNTLKNLACVAVILAALTVVGHELAGRAEAQGGARQVVAGNGGEISTILDSSGDLWSYRTTPGGGPSWYLDGHFDNLPETPVLYSGNLAIMANGDVYARSGMLVTNVFTGGGPTAVQPQTWSQIKAAHGPK